MSDYLGFLKTEDFLALPRDSEPWLVKPLLPLGGRLNIYGQPKKARKSYFALGLAWAVSSGPERWLGFECRQKGPVLYLQADTPHTTWAQRVDDICKGGYDLSDVYFASLQTIPYPLNVMEHEDVLHEMIQEVSKTADPVMVIFDTGAAIHTLDENKQQDMTLFMHALDRIAGTQAKVLITHDRKGGSGGSDKGGQQGSDDHEAEGGDLMKGNRGSGAVAGAMDTVIKLTPKGNMYFQGRAVGEQHKKLKFVHKYGEMGFMWEEDVEDEVVEARRLIQQFQNGSERSLARLLAKSQGMEEERARAIIRRQKEKI